MKAREWRSWGDRGARGGKSIFARIGAISDETERNLTRYWPLWESWREAKTRLYRRLDFEIEDRGFRVFLAVCAKHDPALGAFEVHLATNLLWAWGRIVRDGSKRLAELPGLGAMASDDARTSGRRPRARRADEAMRENLAELVEGLSARERRVVRARFWESRTVGEVARELGTSRRTVERAHTAAMERLRSRIGEGP